MNHQVLLSCALALCAATAAAEPAPADRATAPTITVESPSAPAPLGEGATPQPPPEPVAPPPVSGVRAPMPRGHHGGGPFPPPRLVPVPMGSGARASKPRARAGRVAIAVGGVLGFARDRGYDVAFDPKVQAGFDLAAAYDVWRGSGPFRLALGGSVRRSVGESADERVSLRLGQITFDAIARAEVLPVLPVFVRAGVGLGSARVELSGTEGEQSARDTGALLQLGAGAALQTAPGWFENERGRMSQLVFGLSGEGGYTLGTAYAPRFESDAALGTERTYASPGKLSPRGGYARVQFFVRF